MQTPEELQDIGIKEINIENERYIQTSLVFNIDINEKQIKNLKYLPQKSNLYKIPNDSIYAINYYITDNTYGLLNELKSNLDSFNLDETLKIFLTQKNLTLFDISLISLEEKLLIIPIL